MWRSITGCVGFSFRRCSKMKWKTKLRRHKRICDFGVNEIFTEQQVMNFNNMVRASKVMFWTIIACKTEVYKNAVGRNVEIDHYDSWAHGPIARPTLTNKISNLPNFQWFTNFLTQRNFLECDKAKKKESNEKESLYLKREMNEYYNFLFFNTIRLYRLSILEMIQWKFFCKYTVPS